MATKLFNRAQMTVSGTPGTGDIVLGAATRSFQTFAAAGAVDGDMTPYLIEVDGADLFEIGYGTYNGSGPSITRTQVVASSAGGTTKVNVPSGARISATVLALDLSSVGGSAGTGTSLVQSAASTDTMQCSFLKAPTSGNLLVALTTHKQNTTPTTASGWTKGFNQDSGGYEGFTVYTKTAGAAEPTTQTPATSSDVTSAVIFEVANPGGSVTLGFDSRDYARTLTSGAIAPSFKVLMLMSASCGQDTDPPSASISPTVTVDESSASSTRVMQGFHAILDAGSSTTYTATWSKTIYINFNIVTIKFIDPTS